jgi:hypothetical protein
LREANKKQNDTAWGLMAGPALEDRIAFVPSSWNASDYGLTMSNRLIFIATGTGLAAGIFCAISLDSNSAVSRIGETIYQREDPYLADSCSSQTLQKRLPFHIK